MPPFIFLLYMIPNMHNWAAVAAASAASQADKRAVARRPVLAEREAVGENGRRYRRAGELAGKSQK